MNPQQPTNPSNPRELTLDIFYRHLEETPLLRSSGFDLEKCKTASVIKSLSMIGSQLSTLFKIKLKEKNITNNNFDGLSVMNAHQCKNLIKDKVYICYDCKNCYNAYLCQQCFYGGRHDRHCRHQIIEIDEEMQGPFYCQCGDYSRIKYRGTCHRHHHYQSLVITPSNNINLHLNPQPTAQQLSNYSNHIIKCLKTILSFYINIKQCRKDYKQDKDKILKTLSCTINQNFCKSSKFFEQLSNLIKNTSHNIYIVTTQQVLLTEINMKQSFTQQQIKLINNDRKLLPDSVTLMNLFFAVMPLSKEFYNLVEDLLSVSNVRFIQSIFKNLEYNKGSQPIKQISFIKKIRKTNKIQPKLFCKFLQKSISNNDSLFKNQIQLAQALELLTQVSYIYCFLSKQEKVKHIMQPCWEYLYKRGYLTIENIVRNPYLSIGAVFSNLVYMPQLFSGVFQQYIKYVDNSIKEKYRPTRQNNQNANNSEQNINENQTTSKIINIPQMFNAMAIILMQYTSADIVKSAQFLHSLNNNSKQQIIVIFCWYLREFIQSNGENANMLSQQSIFILGLYCNMVKNDDNQQIYQKYVMFWQEQFKNSSQLDNSKRQSKILNFIKKFLNLLFNQQLKWITKLYNYTYNFNEITAQQRNYLSNMQYLKLKQFLQINNNDANRKSNTKNQKNNQKSRINQINQILSKETVLSYEVISKILEECGETDDCKRSKQINEGKDNKNKNQKIDRDMKMEEKAQQIRNRYKYSKLLKNIQSQNIQDTDQLSYNAQDYDENDKNYHTTIPHQLKQQIITGIFTPLLPILCTKQQFILRQQPQQNHKLLQNNNLYSKYVCLIVIDKIVQGRIKQLKQYLELVRKQLASDLIQEGEREGSEKRIMRLFQIQKYKEKADNKNQCLTEINPEINQNFKINKRLEDQIELLKPQTKSAVKNQIQSKLQQKTQQSTQLAVITNKMQQKRKKLAQKYDKKRQTYLQLLPSPSSSQSIPSSLSSLLSTSYPSLKLITLPQPQICMICKQQSHQNNQLYYLGVLKKQTTHIQIFDTKNNNSSNINSNSNGGDSCGYSITTCMHILHEHCFIAMCKTSNFNGNVYNPNNVSQYTCPLCKTQSNVILPLQPQPLPLQPPSQSQQQQLQLQLQYSSSSSSSPLSTAMPNLTQQFLQNRFNYLFVQLFNQYHHDRCFILLLRSLIAELKFQNILRVLLMPCRNVGDGIDYNYEAKAIDDKNTLNINHKKIKYYIQLLANWWHGMIPCEQQYYKIKINQLIANIYPIQVDNLQSSTITKTTTKTEQTSLKLISNNPKLLLDQIVIQLTLSKIMSSSSSSSSASTSMTQKYNQFKFEQKVYQLLQKLQNQISQLRFKQTLSALRQLFSLSIPYTSVLTQQQRMLANNSDFFKVPVQVTRLMKVTKICQNCKKQQKQLKINYCLICNLSVCVKCGHDKFHGQTKIYVDMVTANLCYIDKHGKFIQKGIYYNRFGQVWSPRSSSNSGMDQIDNIFRYKVHAEKFNEAVAQWLTSLKRQ